MRILHNVHIRGQHKQTLSNALIDTGASVSMLAEKEAHRIGAWLTNHSIHVSGVHGDTRKLDVLLADIKFPGLGDVGGRFAFVLGQATIVGMDILNPLGVVIDTSTGELSVKNDVWESFKTIAATGVIVWGAAKVLDAISEKPRKPKARRKRNR